MSLNKDIETLCVRVVSPRLQGPFALFGVLLNIPLHVLNGRHEREHRHTGCGHCSPVRKRRPPAHSRLASGEPCTTDSLPLR